MFGNDACDTDAMTAKEEAVHGYQQEHMVLPRQLVRLDLLSASPEKGAHLLQTALIFRRDAV